MTVSRIGITTRGPDRSLSGESIVKYLLFAGALFGAGLIPWAALAELPSSPAEKAQTRALNESGVNGTTTSPATLNGQGPQEPPNQAAGAASGMPESTMPVAQFDPNSFVPLRTIDVDRLHSADVVMRSGKIAGRAVDVKLSQDGEPVGVEVALNDGREVWIASDSLRFNPADNVLLTNKSWSDLEDATDDGVQSPE
jgi:hypothetical protein